MAALRPATMATVIQTSACQDGNSRPARMAPA